MTDGAHLHLTADAAMKAVVAGVPPPELLTDEAFEQMIRQAPYPETWEEDGVGYAAYANYTARLILEMYEQYPMLRDVPSEWVFIRNTHGDPNYDLGSAVTTIDDIFKRLHPDGTPGRKVYSELSGFQWGWAMNAARSILRLGPVPNPAILTVHI
jgi:hypothetical protein